MWEQYAFDPSERAQVGVRSRQWTAVAATELEVVRELARCLPADPRWAGAGVVGMVEGPAVADLGSVLAVCAGIDTPRSIVGRMKGDRVEAMVDTGQGVQTFDIVATRAGRRIEVVTSRGVVEVREVTRTGQVVRTGRFMATRLIALVEHPATDERGRVEVTTRHRLEAGDRG